MYELLIRCGKLVVLLGLSLSIPVKLSYFITKCDIVIILEDNVWLLNLPTPAVYSEGKWLY